MQQLSAMKKKNRSFSDSKLNGTRSSAAREGYLFLPQILLNVEVVMKHLKIWEQQQKH